MSRVLDNVLIFMQKFIFIKKNKNIQFPFFLHTPFCGHFSRLHILEASILDLFQII